MFVKCQQITEHSNKMFGLLQHNNLNKENHYAFRQSYCGTCKTMGKIYGQKERFLLNNDVVFLSELLAQINNCEEDFKYIKINTCFNLPKNQKNIPNFLKYSAAVNILLGYYKILDNSEDSKYNINVWQAIKTLEFSNFKKAKAYLSSLGLQIELIEDSIKEQFKREKSKKQFTDFRDTFKHYSELTGIITGEVFKYSASVIGKDNLSIILNIIGKKYGEIVYLIDAIEDYEKDIRNNSFNIFEYARNQSSNKIDKSSEQEVFNYIYSNISIIQTSINLLPISQTKKEVFCRRLIESISHIAKSQILDSNKDCNHKISISINDRYKYALKTAKNISLRKKRVALRTLSFVSVATVLLIVFLLFPYFINAGSTDHHKEVKFCGDCCGKCCRCDKCCTECCGDNQRSGCGGGQCGTEQGDKFQDTFCHKGFCISCCAILGIGSLCGSCCDCGESNTEGPKIITITKIVEVDKGCGCK